MITIEYTNLENINKVAKQLWEYGKGISIWAFYGEMGSGKTTIIREIVRYLGATTEANSPTFAIINEYPLNNIQSVYHIDLYRIHHIKELVEIGFEEYLSSDNYIFIEWPHIAEPILQHYKIFKIELNMDTKGNRWMNVYV
ncbi:MAG: tRNA (adenosine(37)-N6)-threonylcarbamoyltransferase complex ATPase subunit type 1 TsaE [Bacteroidales bacterium]|nr:tRNA (adenosine(37)-N6)-threonylcarbamoyltransferase complex ATPase subunit type 1 TsaE [Bacteroidales bacterium]